jgi:hypothetical protein
MTCSPGAGPDAEILRLRTAHHSAMKYFPCLFIDKIVYIITDFFKQAKWVLL